jgi:hypothetical protein
LNDWKEGTKEGRRKKERRKRKRARQTLSVTWHFKITNPR